MNVSAGELGNRVSRSALLMVALSLHIPTIATMNISAGELVFVAPLRSYAPLKSTKPKCTFHVTELAHVSVSLSMTSEAKEALQQWMGSSGMSRPIPGISWSRAPKTDKHGWMIGLYERDEIPKQFRGHIFEVDGIEFFASQGSFATEKLAGKAIGQENGKYVVE